MSLVVIVIGIVAAILLLLSVTQKKLGGRFLIMHNQVQSSKKYINGSDISE